VSSEEGIVIKLDSISDSTAWVKTARSSACESCSARGSCNAESGGKVMEVKALNAAGARVGDRVVVTIMTSSLFKVSFLLYIFPVLWMIGGALIGQQLALALGHRDPSGLSVLMAFAFFGGAFLMIRLKGKSMARNAKYVPRIIKILRHRSDNSQETGPLAEVKSDDPLTG
jgi:sigma-E factor negative regulatory protein RseC